MNKIGFNLLPWSAGVSAQVFPLLSRLKTIGYDGVECFIGSADVQEYKSLANCAKDLELSVDGVFVVDEGNNPISSDPSIRKCALDKIKWAIDRGHDMNSTIICGPFHSAHSIFVNRPSTKDELNYCAEVLHQAGEYAQQAGITLALEAVNRFENYLCNTMSQLRDLVELINHPHVRAMYDTHHANIEEKEIKQPIETISPFLAHVHISENDRGTPGKGLVHWDEVFKTLKANNYQGWFTIESFSRSDPDFANAINVWREYSDPWEIAEEGYSFIKSHLIKNNF